MATSGAAFLLGTPEAPFCGLACTGQCLWGWEASQEASASWMATSGLCWKEHCLGVHYVLRSTTQRRQALSWSNPNFLRQDVRILVQRPRITRGLLSCLSFIFIMQEVWWLLWYVFGARHKGVCGEIALTHYAGHSKPGLAEPCPWCLISLRLTCRPPCPEGCTCFIRSKLELSS